MAAGTFILSFDCEGKWGVADHVDAQIDAAFTYRRLMDAYEELLSTLARHRIHATFACVTALLLDADQRGQLADGFRQLAGTAPGWMRAYTQRRTGDEGWHLPELLSLLRAHPLHEVGLHGFSHLPIGRSEDPVRVKLEIRHLLASCRVLDLTPTTLVFPRNQIGHLDLLAEAGLRGYRAAQPRSQRWGRARALLQELDCREPAEPRSQSDEPLVPVPAGRFLNWRSGARRFIPHIVTIERWRHLVRDAADRGGVAHMWLHPHNLITDSGMGGTLDEILAEVARLRDQGRLEIMTMYEYANDRRRDSGVRSTLGARVASPVRRRQAV